MVTKFFKFFTGWPLKARTYHIESFSHQWGEQVFNKQVLVARFKPPATINLQEKLLKRHMLVTT
jgi:hypothetical protein